MGVQTKLLGAGTTPADRALALGGATAGAALVLAIAAANGAAWAWWQWAVAAVLAFDLVGGAVVNASEPGRRYWHRPGRTGVDHWGFVAGHVVHVLVFTWAFRAGDWRYAVVVSALLLAGAAAILAAPPERRRATAFVAVALAVVVDSGLAGGADAGVRADVTGWFAPVLFVKLFAGYLAAGQSAGTPGSGRPPA